MSRPSRNPAALLNLFFYPRTTIDLLLEEPDPQVEYGLSAAFGITQILPLTWEAPGPAPLLLGGLSGLVYGVIMLHVGAYALALAGSAFGGGGDVQEMRTVIVWSKLPLLIVLLVLGLLGGFGPSPSGGESRFLILFALFLYTSYLGVLFLMRAHGFGVMRCLATYWLADVIGWLTFVVFTSALEVLF